MSFQVYEIHMTPTKDDVPVGETLVGQFRGTINQLHKSLRRDLGLSGPEYYRLTKHGEAETIASEGRMLKYKIVGPIE